MSTNFRKCRACLLPVKGHAGPPGIGKCQAVHGNTSTGQDKLAKNTKSPTVSNINDVKKVVNLTEKETDCTKDIVITAQQQGNKNKRVRFEEKTCTIKPIEGVEDETEPEINDESSSLYAEIMSTDSEDDTSHFLDEINENLNYSPPKNTEDSMEGSEQAGDCEKLVDYNDNKIETSHAVTDPNCSLGEASLCFDSKDGEEERRRLSSLSDTNVDIRNIILGRSFVLCICGDLDCCCEGEVKFTDSLQEDMGVVENVYMDPLSDFQVDFKPRLGYSKSGWIAKEPNSIKLKWLGVSSSRVTGCFGQVVFTASRVVEMVNRRKELSTVIQGTLKLTLDLAVEVKNSGYSNCLKYKVVECNLFMLEEEEATVAEDRNSGD
eukprot:GFUD01005979.1.p1 GENE.GFUD01005979.1~~GFUD01005979.1.p1  ORF type:complete len:378 (-),score=119.63 GFUD01005979.1:142-1275(-)